ncbi:MAG: hypothetical protein M3345_04505 [Actinomycetota bacterium]|nr:hypothetical protein [Actinomycetota bacterium]
MRTLIALLVATFLLLLAGSAVAEVRDPFDPVIDLSPDVGTGVGTGTGADPGSGTGLGDPLTSGGPGDDPLSDTGSDASSWLALAYLLGALGVGALTVAKTFEPFAPRRASQP